VATTTVTSRFARGTLLDPRFRGEDREAGHATKSCASSKRHGPLAASKPASPEYFQDRVFARFATETRCAVPQRAVAGRRTARN
jgi:hypothetical protein